jgi:hypothetical protein
MFPLSAAESRKNEAKGGDAKDVRFPRQEKAHDVKSKTISPRARVIRRLASVFN